MKFRFIAALLSLCLPSLAQPLKSFSTLEHGRVVFNDNLAHDTVGKLPTKFKVLSPLSKIYGEVKKGGNKNTCWMANDTYVEPVCDKLHGNDLFKLDLQFKLLNGNQPSLAIRLCDTTIDNKFRNDIYIIIPDTGKAYFMQQGINSFERKLHINDSLPLDTWHKATFYYRKGELGCVIDDKSMFIEDQKIIPPALGSFTIGTYHSGEIKDVKITVANANASFDNILTEQKLITHSINFEAGQASLQPASISYVKELATWMRQHPAVKLQIDGHTDSDGTPEANKKLSYARADAVKNELIKNGIAPERMSAMGWGSEKPLQKGNNPEAKAANRRVELINIK